MKPDNKPSKNLTANGKTEVIIEDNKLTIAAVDGLSAVTVTDARGNVLYMYHPMSGWYIEYNMRKEESNNE